MDLINSTHTRGAFEVRCVEVISDHSMYLKIEIDPLKPLPVKKAHKIEEITRKPLFTERNRQTRDVGPLGYKVYRKSQMHRMTTD